MDLLGVSGTRGIAGARLDGSAVNIESSKSSMPDLDLLLLLLSKARALIEAALLAASSLSLRSCSMMSSQS